MKSQVASKIQRIFIEGGVTLSLAESCTGGAIAAELTGIPGCSQYFLGSIVAYSNRIKTSLLKVDPLLIEKESAFCGPVVSIMAENVLKLMNSDYSLAVSGIAGPDGGTVENPVGTIWVAIHKKGGVTKVESLDLTGERQEIIEQCVQELLCYLLKTVEMDLGGLE